MMRKSKFSLTGIMLLTVLLLQGCGHKGPLYLPKNPVPAPPTDQKK
jgi:predicted small lipoprotein YifL